MSNNDLVTKDVRYSWFGAAEGHLRTLLLSNNRLQYLQADAQFRWVQQVRWAQQVRSVQQVR